MSATTVSIDPAPQRIIMVLSVVLIAGFLMTGCQRPPYSREDAFAITSELFSPGDFKHTLERNGTGRMEILHATTSNRTVSVMFVEAYQIAVISDAAVFPRSVMKGWKALQGKEVAFGVQGRVETPMSNVNFERFSYQGNACFSFHSLYDPSGFDTQSGYTKLVVGYYCQTQTPPLTDASVAKFLGSITVPKFESAELAGELTPNTYYVPDQPLTIRSKPPGRD